MTLHTIPELDRAGLRKFGLTTGAIVGVLFGLFFPWLLERPWPRWPWVVFGVLAAFALVAPNALNPVYKVWMRFGLIMSRITTPLIMGLAFFVVISPVAFIKRMAGKDSMNRTFDQKAASYRTQRAQASQNHFERPF